SKTSVGTITDDVIQSAIDYLDENVGSTVDYITCSSDVKRLYQAYLATYRRNIDVMELQGGFKAISYNGIPVVSDRFVEDGTMYLLNTKEFELHQLCDWQWLASEDGRILKQNAGYPTYSATLVKYADLICNKPAGQAKLSGINA
ncbi:MAG: phage major capsid protein, partial [Christensenellales bacterium]